MQQVKLVPTIVTPVDRPKLSYRLKTRSLVTATLLDESGAVAATLFHKLKKPGVQSYAWTGVTVPDGNYRATIHAADVFDTSNVPLAADSVARPQNGPRLA